MSGTAAILASNRAAPTPSVVSNFAKNSFDWETLLTTTAMPTGGSISRNGNAMVYDSTGKLTWAANNLFLWSQDFRNTATAGSSRPWSWGGTTTVATNVAGVTAPDGTSTVSRVSGFSTSDGDVGLSQNVTIAPTRIVGSIYVRGESADIGKKVLLRVKRISGTAVSNDTEITLTGDWQRLSSSMTMAADNTGVQFILSGAAASNQASSCLIWGAQLEAVTYHGARTYLPTTTAARYEPRFDVDPATLQPRGLLLEGARTNVATYSENFATTGTHWAGYGTIPATTSSGFSAPDGTTNAYKITAGGAQYGGMLRNSAIILGASTTYAVSVYAKAGNVSTLGIRPGANGISGSATICYFNLSTGVANAVTTSSGSVLAVDMTPVGNSWYRCWLVYSNPTSSTGTFDIGIVGTTGSTTAIPTSGDNLYIWGLQAEVGSFITSYLPNGSSTSGTSRAAETFTLTGYANRLIEAYWIEQETGVASSIPETVVSSGAVTINPPQFGWITSLRAYTNAYAGDIATPSWIDNSGTNGNRMYTDSTGTLTWAPANMLIWSDDQTKTSWTAIAANTTATDASTVNFTTSGAYRYCSNPSGIMAGQSLIFSAVISSGTKTGTIVMRDASSLTSQVVTLTPTPTRYFFKFTANGTVAQVGFDNRAVVGGDGGTGTVIISNCQLEAVTYQTHPRLYLRTEGAQVYQPRYDFDGSTTPASPRGMLIEEARTNILTNTQDFDAAAWTKTRLNTTGTPAWVNVATAPDGTMSADKLIEEASGSSHFANQAVTVTNGSTYTYSVYAKAAERKYLALYCINTAAALNTFFNLSNGTIVSTSSGATAAITPVGNGWYRCSVTTTTTSTTSGIYPGISPDGVNASYTGDGVSGIFVWGAQVELGAFATSYVPNLASTGTSLRVADVVKLSGTALTTLQGPAISVIGEATVSGFVAGISNFVFSASDGTANNRFYSIAAASGAGNAAVVTGGVTQANMTTANTTTAGSPFRIAAAFANNNAAAVLNNGTVVPDTSLTMPVVSQAGLGYYNVSPNVFLNGCIRSYAIYNQRLPDATLKAKSAVGAAY